MHEGGSITTRLIMSNSRFAPLKTASIPRLELLGALIGLRSTRQVFSALKIPMNVGTGSKGQSRKYKPFIGHRVGETHDFSAPNHWRYVPTNVNPADPGHADLWWNCRIL